VAKQIFLKPAQTDLAKVIADLIQSGYRIEIAPVQTGYGVVYLSVRVYRGKKTITRRDLHCVYEKDELVKSLRRVRAFDVTSIPPTTE